MNKVKGDILEITTIKDEFMNISYQFVVRTEKMPELKLGKCEVSQ